MAESIRFAELQLNGPYDFPRFRKAVGDVGDRKGDVMRLKRWEAVSDGTRKVDISSPTSLAYANAVSDLGNLCAAIQGAEWSGADPLTWILLRKGVIAANLLSTMPDQALGEGVSLRDGFIACAFMVDCMGRISDEHERKSFVRDVKAGFSDDFILKRALPIYIDFICGRGGAWLNYIDDMGVVAMEGRGGSWWQLRDQVAIAGVNHYVQTSAGILGVDEDTARAFHTAELSLLGDFYDRWQYTMRKEATHAKGANAFADEVTFKKCRTDGANPFIQDKSMDMFGYCRAFGTSAVACVFDIPRTSEVDTRRLRIQKVSAARKAQQAKARKRFRLPQAR